MKIKNFSKNNIHLATYGDGRIGFIQAAERLEDEAHSSGWFSSVSNWSLFELQQLDPKWFNQHADFIENNSRGNGYWLWKSKIIQLMLAGLPENDILLYLDAGDELNLSGEEKFNQYVELTNKHGLLAFYLNESLPDRKVRQWTKKNLLNKSNILNENDPILEAPQVEAGMLLIKNTPNARAFVQKWLDTCEADQYSYLNDDPSNISESIEFIEHRHDQSILTLLLFKYKFGMILYAENYFPQFWENNQHPSYAPFAHLRNATGIRRLEQMHLTNEPKMGGLSSDLNWFHRFNLINDGSAQHVGEILDIENYQPKADKNSISIIDTFQDLKGKSQDFYRNRSHKLFRSFLIDSNQAIFSLKNTLAKKEEIIQEQKSMLDQRLSLVNEKEEMIQSLSKEIDLLQWKIIYLEKNHLILLLDYRYVAKLIFPEKFLMPLRRLKHRIFKRLP